MCNLLIYPERPAYATLMRSEVFNGGMEIELMNECNQSDRVMCNFTGNICGGLPYAMMEGMWLFNITRYMDGYDDGFVIQK